jgi:hypothetical protein
MPKFYTKNGKVRPITPKIYHSQGFQPIPIPHDDMSQATSSAALMVSRFGIVRKEEQLKLKRAMVSAANKARAQGHPEVAEVYEKAYKQMNIDNKNTVYHVRSGHPQTYFLGDKFWTVRNNNTKIEYGFSKADYPSEKDAIKAMIRKERFERKKRQINERFMRLEGKENKKFNITLRKNTINLPIMEDKWTEKDKRDLAKAQQNIVNAEKLRKSNLKSLDDQRDKAIRIMAKKVLDAKQFDELKDKWFPIHG